MVLRVSVHQIGGGWSHSSSDILEDEINEKLSPYRYSQAI